MYSKVNQNKIEKMIKKYKLVNKSPYSKSYYSEGLITWGHKPEGSYRLSDHWNFYSEGEMHCITECGTRKGWYVGVYHNGVYTLIEQVFNEEDMRREDACFDRYLKMLNKIREKEQQKIKEENRKRANEQARLKTLLDNGGNFLVSYTVSIKKGCHFSTKEYEEKCFCKGCWAFTSNGKKRVFKIIGAY